MSYADIIAGAIGVNDRATLAAVEDAMRHIVFHSTLDWQTRKQLEQGAREAYGLVRLQRRSKSRLVLPEDAETARLLGVHVSDIPALAQEAAHG